MEIALLMLLFPTAGFQSSALAAERIYASYAALERSISVDALEIYAKEGKLDDDLAGLRPVSSPTTASSVTARSVDSY